MCFGLLTKLKRPREELRLIDSKLSHERSERLALLHSEAARLLRISRTDRNAELATGEPLEWIEAACDRPNVRRQRGR